MATTDPFHAATAISGGTGKVNDAQLDFIQQHATDGDMTAQQAAQLLELGMGDTGLPENIELPELDPENAPAAVPTDAELTADNATLMAKDGKHVIDFQKLVDAREGEKTWRATAEQAQQELEALKAAAQQREDAGIAPTVADNQLAAASAAIDAGANPDLFGDFSEEAIAAGVKALVSQQVSAEVAKALAPMQQQSAKTSADAKFDAHLKAIAEAHPDFESLAESKELSDWIDSQPSIARNGYRAALERGTTDQYIELFSTFKAATGSSQAPSATSAKDAAKAAIAKSQLQAPLSLSDIPGGKAVALGRDEAMAAMNPHELAEAMQSMTPKQIEDYMSRNL
jgi:DNA-binding NarL/FixJ family response regulator